MSAALPDSFHLSLRNSITALLNPTGSSPGHMCVAPGTIAWRWVGMQAAAASAINRNKGRVRSPRAITTGALICPSWAQLIGGGGA